MTLGIGYCQDSIASETVESLLEQVSTGLAGVLKSVW